jgi:hypothetical protein
MWYVSHTKNEYYKPLSMLNEYLVLLTFAKVYDISFNFLQIALFYITVLFVFFITGLFLVRIGIVRYNTTLSNTQNEELMAIKKDVAWIKRNIR